MLRSRIRAAARRSRRRRASPIIDNRKQEPRARGFQTFSLDGRILRGIRAAGFEEPRPIQAKTIPSVLRGQDVLGLAQTGTGKTAAFGLPILDMLLARGRRGRGPRALILAPTRELAMQIETEISDLGRFTPVRSTAVFGGVPIGKQVRALQRGPDILVACPGRLLELVQRRDVDLRGVEILVLDEADHMFDMGFLPDIRRILDLLPRERQNLLFSATMPREIRRLTDNVLRRPKVVELQHSAPAETIEHALYPVDDADKQTLLEHLFHGDDFTSAIVFLRTKHRAKRLAERLSRRGHSAIALQGNMSQSQRDRAMQGFRSGRFDVLVATDIAARGIDVAGISHVVNYDVPHTADAYTHRIGRTGRSERQGKACTFVTGTDRAQIKAIEQRLGKRIERVHVEGFESSGRRSGSSTQAQRPFGDGLDRRPARGGPARRPGGPARKTRGSSAPRPGKNGRRKKAGASAGGGAGASSGVRKGGRRVRGGAAPGGARSGPGPGRRRRGNSRSSKALIRS